MAVGFHTDGIRFTLRDKRKTTRWINGCIDSHGKRTGDLAVIFTSSLRIREINRKYLNHNFATDVITFSYGKEDVIEGDIFVCIEQVWKNARFYGEEQDTELRRVIIHGVLHLLGYKDENEQDRELMKSMEDKYVCVWKDE